MPTTDLYKITYSDGRPCNGGSGQWHLPTGKRPGKWMPPVNVAPCRSGYHVCTAEQLLNWLGPGDTTVWAAEIRGETIDHGDKIVAAEARLLYPVLTQNDQLLLASDFAAHVAHLNNDPRVWAAIKATRDYANGRIDAAAWYAARDAAGAAAAAAAWYAARAAAGAAAWYAARAAAGAAAWYAARAAARAAARTAERDWQTQHVTAVLTGKKQPGRERRRNGN